MRKLKIVITTFLLFWVGFGHTQNIIEAEYFFDTDPGIGNANPINITPGDSVDQISDIPTTSLAAGFHTLYIRVKDDNSKWSMYGSRKFYSEPDNIPYPSAKLSEAEYFFDTDPGTGKGTSINIIAGDSIDFIENIITAGLTEGFHTLYIRFINDSSKWSMYGTRKFYVQGNPIENPHCILTEAEYFFDTDPGTGNGIPIIITPGDSLDFIPEFPITGLGIGFHTVHIRFRNDSSKWSMCGTRKFYVQDQAEVIANVNLIEAEYFFDIDPGIGNGIPMSIIPDDSIDIIADVPIDTLQVGFHDVYVRFLDDNLKWSMYGSWHFYVQQNQIIQIHPQLINAEYFIDSDPGLGNGTAIPMAPSDSLDVQLSIDNLALDSGYHYFYARVMNADSIWSQYGSDTFLLRDCEYPHADFSTSNVCIGDTVYFNDLSTSG